MATVSSSSSQLHFILLPLMSPGHTIPLLHTSTLLSHHHPNLHFTLVTTTATLLPSPLPTNLHLLHLPLPTDISSFVPHFLSLPSLRLPLELHLRSLPPPSCILSDFAHPWSRSLAADLHIPWLLFYGIPCFSLLCLHRLRSHPFSNDPLRPIVIPNLPHRVVVTRAQAPGFFSLPGLEGLQRDLYEAERTCDGVVVNSFDDLEGGYVEEYEKEVGKKVWTIGPVGLAGRPEEKGEEGWWRWLEGKGEGEVVYVAFGSVVVVGAERLVEVGMGLEESGRPFLWVVRWKEGEEEVVEEWLKGFERRVAGRGLVIRGWAPQVRILNHPAVGAFVTHGGWSSTLEGLCAGVPMVMWPHFADQFLNERLVVDVLKAGVGIGVTEPFQFGRNEKAYVGRDMVAKAVREVMDRGEVGEGRRSRAREIAAMAREAVGEGGSSDRNIGMLIEHVKIWQEEKMTG